MAEELRGAPAFRELATDPPSTEREFIQMWKLYFLTLMAASFDEHRIRTPPSFDVLKKAGLLSPRTLTDKLKAVVAYIKSMVNLESVELGMGIDPLSGQPNKVYGKVSPRSGDAASNHKPSFDELLNDADQALKSEGNELWICIDRLDVAFEEHPVLERNALRALFKTYLDLFAFPSVRFKIFLRSDIWRRLTADGFREASHITRTLTIQWDSESLLNLVIRRLLQSDELLRNYLEDRQTVLGSLEAQQRLFYRIFPGQIDVGKKKPTTWDWMLTRTRDGTGHTAPRELIHLLIRAREIQLQKLGVGTDNPESTNLFHRAVFKHALQVVSKTRLEQTLYAEYPKLRAAISKLEGEKATQTAKSLTALWAIEGGKAQEVIEQLCDVGFFERKGSKDSPEFSVPFLYRDSLKLVQGVAETA